MNARHNLRTALQELQEVVSELDGLRNELREAEQMYKIAHKEANRAIRAAGAVEVIYQGKRYRADGNEATVVWMDFDGIVLD